MEMPLAEVIDRYTITLLKSRYLKEENTQEQLNAYRKAIAEFRRKGIAVKRSWIDRLVKVNNQIWQLEYAIRKGLDEQLGFEEIGKRAVQIRNFNKIRVGIKNEIVEKTGDGFKDIKVNHVSQ